MHLSEAGLCLSKTIMATNECFCTQRKRKEAPGRTAIGQRSPGGQRSKQGSRRARHSSVLHRNYTQLLSLIQILMHTLTLRKKILLVCQIRSAVYAQRLWVCKDKMCGELPLGFACCIMHQSGSLRQEPRGTDSVAVPAPRRAPGFTPHEGDMNNRGQRPDCSTTEEHRLTKVCLVKVRHLRCANFT